jgi:hypothetical protein
MLQMSPRKQDHTHNPGIQNGIIGKKGGWGGINGSVNLNKMCVSRVEPT